MQEPSFTVGIEEEYLLVDKHSRDLTADPPAELMQRCEERLNTQVTTEFLRCQIEVGTRVHTRLADARDELATLRRTVADVTGEAGLAPIAASTHPFARWDIQKPTDKARYFELAQALQGVGRRLVICGMHVHVGLDDDELRIDLMKQVSYFLPHLLALSTSSPFWRGVDSGLKSYRVSVFNELPRTGLPETFNSHSEYLRHIDVLVRAGLIQDASRIWWDVRPSMFYPTLELRLTDVCTRMDDAIGIAALYRCLLRMLYRLRRRNQRWRVYAPMLIDENRWRAQRYGIDEGLVDFGLGTVVPYAELLEEMIELTAEDAAFFGCEAEVQGLRDIIQRGTSAHRQLAVYRQALAEGLPADEALRHVVDSLIQGTIEGLA